MRCELWAQRVVIAACAARAAGSSRRRYAEVFARNRLRAASCSGSGGRRRTPAGETRFAGWPLLLRATPRRRTESLRPRYRLAKRRRSRALLDVPRAEEHTFELQSPWNVGCPLLLHNN